MDKAWWQKLFFWQKNMTQHSLGLYLAADGIWVHVIDSDEPDVEYPLANDNLEVVLMQILKDFGAARCFIILAAERYQLLQVDKPAVDGLELNQALLWSVKDMVSLPTAQLHLDYYEMPSASVAKLNVVVADKNFLKRIVHSIYDKGGQIAAISTEEIAMTLLAPEDDPQAQMLLSHYRGQELLLTVVKQGQLYMQRRLRGFHELEKISADELNFGAADNLSLELQRSMDYFESQLRQAPVSTISILSDGASTRLAELVGANFNQTVVSIDKASVGSKFAQLACADLLKGVE
ncbi:MSHA biogenesis protein MshI [Shewanella sp. NIFS-20-20]|uniref:MSHA biogenesis protein MshI n=1 Tax=Shewanella sp. NIFS-20-20 TaxID=2853806 RepID=UPI001C48B674|nr:MSHA biogenesis protein MshI [Shewanella sp. NIFS-20-20]MBV7317374.1 MSHA biogenesis protein MshI [Shewanella sp. NIFS-20-20]